jgi:hypothetical protein
MGREVPHWTGRDTPSPAGDLASGGHRGASERDPTSRRGRTASVVARSLVALALAATISGCGSDPERRPPAACLEAIQAARDTAQPVDQAFAALARYPALVARAGEAGLDRDPQAAERVSRDMRRITRELDAAREQLEARVAIFNATAENCR